MSSSKHYLLSLLFLCLAIPSFSQNKDVQLLEEINEKQTGFKDKYLELNASSVNDLSIGIPVGLAIAGFIKHDNQLKRDALYMGTSFLVSSAITYTLKKTINRPRAFDTYSFIVQRDDESGSPSFPSGHTSAAFCLATSLALRYHKWYVVVPAYTYAVSVGWARMYQGVHYPSDVLAGAIVGTGSAWLGWKLQKWMEGRKEKKIMLSYTHDRYRHQYTCLIISCYHFINAGIYQPVSFSCFTGKKTA